MIGLKLWSRELWISWLKESLIDFNENTFLNSEINFYLLNRQAISSRVRNTIQIKYFDKQNHMRTATFRRLAKKNRRKFNAFTVITPNFPSFQIVYTAEKSMLTESGAILCRIQQNTLSELSYNMVVTDFGVINRMAQFSGLSRHVQTTTENIPLGNLFLFHLVLAHRSRSAISCRGCSVDFKKLQRTEWKLWLANSFLGYDFARQTFWF